MCNEEKIADLKVNRREATSEIFIASPKVSTANSQNFETVHLESPQDSETAFLEWLPDLISIPIEQVNLENVQSSSHISSCENQTGQHIESKNVSTLKEEFQSNINYQGGLDASAKKLHATGASQGPCTINCESYEHQSDGFWRELDVQLSTILGNTEVQGTVVDSTALGYLLPNFTTNSIAENGFLTDTLGLENGVNNGLYLSSSHQIKGNALQGTEPLLQTQMNRAVRTDKQSNLLKSAPSSLDVVDLSEVHAQFFKTMPGAFEPTVQKRAAEPFFALQSKKMKGDSLLQTIDQMSGILSECGVNTTEEETRMVPELNKERESSVQEERHNLFLQKKPLQDKLMKLANNWSVPFVSEDVEFCLSLSLEELLRSILNKVIRYSNQCQDMLKDNQKFLVTSDVGAQIHTLRQKAREALKAKELVKQKQAGNPYNENKKVMEVEAAPKSQAHNKNKKKAKRPAAEVTSLQTSETDEMLIKWQIMAEQARQKRENEAGLVSLRKKSELSRRSSTTDSGRIPGDNSQALAVQKSITVNDLIAVLEMDPHMAKSNLLYQFYDRIHAKL